jgi:hypothetical protein
VKQAGDAASQKGSGSSFGPGLRKARPNGPPVQLTGGLQSRLLWKRENGTSVRTECDTYCSCLSLFNFEKASTNLDDIQGIGTITSNPTGHTPHQQIPAPSRNRRISLLRPWFPNRLEMLIGQQGYHRIRNISQHLRRNASGRKERLPTHVGHGLSKVGVDSGLELLFDDFIRHSRGRGNRITNGRTQRNVHCLGDVGRVFFSPGRESFFAIRIDAKIQPDRRHGSYHCYTNTRLKYSNGCMI